MVFGIKKSICLFLYLSIYQSSPVGQGHQVLSDDERMQFSVIQLFQVLIISRDSILEQSIGRNVP